VRVFVSLGFPYRVLVNPTIFKRRGRLRVGGIVVEADWRSKVVNCRAQGGTARLLPESCLKMAWGKLCVLALVTFEVLPGLRHRSEIWDVSMCGRRRLLEDGSNSLELT
jgi:hypothetical protein